MPFGSKKGKTAASNNKLKDKCKGYKLCQKRECFDPGCQRGRFCPKSQTQLKKAPPASSGASLAHAGAPS